MRLASIDTQLSQKKLGIRSVLMEIEVGLGIIQRSQLIHEAYSPNQNHPQTIDMARYKRTAAAGVSSASIASSANKRIRRNSSDIHEDEQAVDPQPEVQSLRGPSSPISSPSILPRNADAESFEQLRAEVSELRRQQVADRVQLRDALDAQTVQLEDLRQVLDGHQQEQMPANGTARGDNSEHESEGALEAPGVKAEVQDGASDLYDATPEPVNSEIDHHSPSPEIFQQVRDLAPITQEQITLYDGMRMPARVRNLAPQSGLNLPDEPNEEFAFSFLKKMFGGSQVSHGYYSISKPKMRGQGRVPLFPQLTSYMALSREYEPLLPRVPGEHGAQISSFMEYRQFGSPFPVFIRDAHSNGYRYYGTYKEPYASDRLGSGEMAELPRSVKDHWAEMLGSERGQKTRKNIIALRDMRPMLNVGWWDNDTKTMVDYDEDLEDVYGELEVVKRRISEEEAEVITSEQILAAFENPDFDEGQSMRLYFEYLECEGYDKEFYKNLVAKKHELQE